VSSQRPFEPTRGGGRTQLFLRSAPDLSRARTTVVTIATDAGVDGDRAGRLAIAVSEIATNALMHAGGAADVEIITTADRVVVEISDRGPGLPPDRAAELPAADQDHGRGLWLAQQLCDRVEIRPAGDGTVITLSVPRSSPPHTTST
jgi:serine/threonine-protein kinase RsbW